MVRILHMIGSLEIGGSQTMVMNIYRKIDREKVQFDFIIDHPDELFFKDEIEKLGGKIYTMPTFKGINIVTVRKAWSSFFKIHPEYKVLHSHVRSYASIYLPIARAHGVTTIIHSHSTSNGSGVISLVKNILQYPLRFQAEYYMACSVEAGRWLFGDKVIRQTNFCVINNAIEAGEFRFNDELREKYRSKLGFRDEVVIGFLSRVTPQKNPLYAIRIFSEALKLDERVKLLFIGDGVLMDDVKRTVRELGIEDSVVFTGFRNDTPGLYAAMDVYCFPSNWEGLGISLVEAQAAGLQSVCSENIPPEAIVTDLVEIVKLGKGEKYWAEKLLEASKKRRVDTYEKIKAAGYDVTENAKKMERFYLNIDAKMRT